MDTFKDYKIKKKTGWFSGNEFEVVERSCTASKPLIVDSEMIVFHGDLLSCEAYIRLSEKEMIER